MPCRTGIRNRKGRPVRSVCILLWGAGFWGRPAPITLAENVRALYSVDRPLTAAPRIPEPYDTFANTFSYGKAVD